MPASFPRRHDDDGAAARACATINAVFGPVQALSVAGSVEAIAVASASVASLQTRSIYRLEAFAWRQ